MFSLIQKVITLNLLNKRITAAKTELINLTAQLKKYDELNSEIGIYRKWKQTIDEIKASRPFLITKKIDQLLDIFQAQPKVWLSSLSIDDKLPAKVKTNKKVIYTFNLSCFSATDNPDNLIKFRKAFQGSDFLQDFDMMNEMPEWSKQEFPETVEGSALRFELFFIKLASK